MPAFINSMHGGDLLKSNFLEHATLCRLDYVLRIIIILKFTINSIQVHGINSMMKGKKQEYTENQ